MHAKIEEKLPTVLFFCRDLSNLIKRVERAHCWVEKSGRRKSIAGFEREQGLRIKRAFEIKYHKRQRGRHSLRRHTKTQGYPLEALLVTLYSLLVANHTSILANHPTNNSWNYISTTHRRRFLAHYFPWRTKRLSTL